MCSLSPDHFDKDTYTCTVAIKYLQAHTQWTRWLPGFLFLAPVMSNYWGGSPGVLQLKAKLHHGMNNEYRSSTQPIRIVVQRRPASPCIKQQDTQLYANGPRFQGLDWVHRAMQNVPVLRMKLSDEEVAMKNCPRVWGGGGGRRQGKQYMYAWAPAACDTPTQNMHSLWKHKSSQRKPGHLIDAEWC